MVATTPASFFTLKNVRVRSSRLATRATISVDLTFSQKTELSVCASGFKLASPRSGAQIWHSSTRAPGPDPAVAMAHIHRDDAEDRGGFNFDNVRRNEMLRGSGLAFKYAMKTGTTISGVCFAGGVVLGADTRSTNGETVADKNCEKIHYIAPNIYCCGAGTAADTEAVTGTCAHRVGDRDRRATPHPI